MTVHLSNLDRLAELGLVACGPDAGPLSVDLDEDGELPEWVHLAPFGTWKGYRRGKKLRSFTIDQAGAVQIVEHFERRGIDLAIDWDHQTLYAPVTGNPAPAAGWVDRLELRADGVWGHVREWTPKAAAQLRNREYRYLSPVLDFNHTDERTGKNVGTVLTSAALTNAPFLDAALSPVVARFDTPGATLMLQLFVLCLAFLGIGSDDPEATTKDQVENAINDFTARFDAACSALGLEPTAKLEDINAAVAASQARMTAACSALGLQLDASLEDIEAAAARVAGEAHVGAVVCSVMELDPGELPEDAKSRVEQELKHSGYVPIDEHTAALTQLGGQVEQLTDEQVLAKARADGKLTPALEGWAQGHIKRDRPGFLAWMSSAPGVPLRSPVHAPPDTPTDDNTLSEPEKAICRQMGLTDEEYLQSRKEG